MTEATAANEAIIRPAEPRDARAINEIRNCYIANTAYNLAYEAESLSETEQWLASLEGKYPVLVAELNGRAVGWASLSAYKPKPGYSRTAENSLYVHKNYHARGIGTRLLSAICEEAAEYGFHRVVAVITADNEKSIGMHLRHGFELGGRLSEVGYKFGKYHDVVFLLKKV